MKLQIKLASQFVTSRCLFAVYNTHISGKYIWSQFDRKFDLRCMFNHETIDGLLALKRQHFYDSVYFMSSI